jgi:acyl-CoA synthetase (AMP-forming)/AMP-acid ligase II
MTIQETMMDVVTRRRGEVFLVDAATSRELTYGEFQRQACALAAELRRRGLSKGDRVAVMVPNCCELAVLYFACIYLGAVIVPINTALSKGDVQFILESCKPALIVASASCAEAIKDFHTSVIILTTAQEALKHSNAPGHIRLGGLAETHEFVPLETAHADDLVVIM